MRTIVLLVPLVMLHAQHHQLSFAYNSLKNVIYYFALRPTLDSHHGSYPMVTGFILTKCLLETPPEWPEDSHYPGIDAIILPYP